jgi:hypothetical protein
MGKGRCLFVGVAPYTRDYYRLVPDPEQFYTLDVDPGKAAYGSPWGHVVGEMEEYEPREKFQTVVLASLFGYKGARCNKLGVAKRCMVRALGWVELGGELCLSQGVECIEEEVWRDFVRAPVFWEFEKELECVKWPNYVWIGKKKYQANYV